MEIKKHGYKIGVFVVNILIVALAICGMKDRDKNKFSLENKTEENVVPIDATVASIQNKIATERENKLRDLNTAPKAIEQQNTVTTKTTTTPEVKTKSPDKKTKTS
ncbi:MAG: hypothetical protein ACD_7C00503G0014 [uncultured bacterium]|nr:MAG: hypothetical protein ACD_7C00503G0014 [uncultured bacterium]KKP68456.1 MAG: hypothetical protein UR66_C0005G0003 [Candidatus Moranbacteria bacterium GW2011_GWE1_35_17]KKP81567.1 MAG: hypothetical protein UR82_C0057G0003 [Candidatus Moranbacteria bacterium GW2011_GWF1_35_5]KKP83868.1 MAG: hypothetical protein UR83_C0032G0013 [Candidatus Moranbacteria bacterium GW2011_GWF2_35_54]HBR79482.1 hypothetical protein [Candidatus Moranbacteria bacterium]